MVLRKKTSGVAANTKRDEKFLLPLIGSTVLGTGHPAKYSSYAGKRNGIRPVLRGRIAPSLFAHCLGMRGCLDSTLGPGLPPSPQQPVQTARSHQCPRQGLWHRRLVRDFAITNGVQTWLPFSPYRLALRLYCLSVPCEKDSQLVSARCHRANV